MQHIFKITNSYTLMKFKLIFLKSFRLLISLALIIISTNNIFAQDNKSDGQDEVSTTVTPHDKNAIFSANASYTFSVKNTYSNIQSGRISYIITDQFNKKLLTDSIHVNLATKSTKDFDFIVPALKAGFYKINFMINVSDYDDTIRRVFGIRADEIRSTHEKPDDFNQFWDESKKELSSIKPDFKITEQPELEKLNQKVYIIEMKSIGNMTIRGWMTMPASRKKNQKLPVLLMLPGYQAATKPLIGHNEDMCFISADVRGQGLNKETMLMRNEDYITYHLEDKNKYYLRGVIMDCLRYMDFICSRPELDMSRISVGGGSMGGYMALATAALDKRVSFCAAQNPIMSDVYNLDNGAVAWPINYMKKYVAIWPGLTFNKVLANLQYFDTKNFAPLISCPVFLGIGLLDPYVPPNNSYVVYNNINSKKKIMVFKDLGHEVGKKYDNYETLWMRDDFALF